jgi:hypothetical protein
LSITVVLAPSPSAPPLPHFCFVRNASASIPTTARSARTPAPRCSSIRDTAARMSLIFGLDLVNSSHHFASPPGELAVHLAANRPNDLVRRGERFGYHCLWLLGRSHRLVQVPVRPRALAVAVGPLAPRGLRSPALTMEATARWHSFRKTPCAGARPVRQRP